MTGRKPDVVIHDDVIGRTPDYSVLVGGSRGWGRCEHSVAHSTAVCSDYQAGARRMIWAFAEHGIGTKLPPTKPIIELIEGDAAGADRMAADLWLKYGFGPVTAYPANWDALGKRAGSVRNGIMVSRMPRLALFFHLDNSRGTADAIRQAKEAGLDLAVYDWNGRIE